MNQAPTRDGTTESTRPLVPQVLTCLRGEWRSIAVVPAQPGLSARPVAEALADAASVVRGVPARLFSAEGLELPGASRLLVDVSTCVAQGGLAVVAMESVLRRPSGLPLARGVDRVLLVVHLGLSSFDAAKDTIARIGRERFLGAVTLEAEREGPPP
jgi:hypothetical protein